MTKKTISCDEAIAEIKECLTQASGDWIAEIYSKVMGSRAEYIEDSMIEVEE